MSNKIKIKHVSFSLKNLEKLDGGAIDRAFMNELRNVLFDCYNRPTMKKARKLSVVFDVVPVPAAQMGEDGAQHGFELDQVEISGQVFSAVPKRQSRKYVMKPETTDRGERNLLFHPDNLSDPDQHTTMDLADQNDD